MWFLRLWFVFHCTVIFTIFTFFSVFYFFFRWALKFYSWLSFLLRTGILKIITGNCSFCQCWWTVNRGLYWAGQYDTDRLDFSSFVLNLIDVWVVAVLGVSDFVFSTIFFEMWFDWIPVDMEYVKVQPFFSYRSDKSESSFYYIDETRGVSYNDRHFIFNLID